MGNPSPAAFRTFGWMTWTAAAYGKSLRICRVYQYPWFSLRESPAAAKALFFKRSCFFASLVSWVLSSNSMTKSTYKSYHSQQKSTCFWAILWTFHVLFFIRYRKQIFYTNLGTWYNDTHQPLLLRGRCILFWWADVWLHRDRAILLRYSTKVSTKSRRIPTHGIA